MDDIRKLIEFLDGLPTPEEAKEELEVLLDIATLMCDLHDKVERIGRALSTALESFLIKIQEKGAPMDDLAMLKRIAGEFEQTAVGILLGKNEGEKKT